MQSPTTTPQTRGLKNYGTVGLLFIVNCLNYMDRYIVFGILPLIQSYYGLTNAQSGLLQTVFMASYVTFSLVCGPIGDALSRKRIMLFGLTLWCVFTFSGSLVDAQNPVLFFVTRSLVGVGEASFTTLGFIIIGDYFSSTSRSRALAAFQAALPVGSGLGYLLGPLVASRTGSWQWALRITPIVGSVCILLLAVVMEEPKRGEAESFPINQAAAEQDYLQQPEEAADQNVSTGRSRMSTLYHDNLLYFAQRPSFILTTLGYSGSSFVFGCLAVWGPKYLEMLNEYFADHGWHLKRNDLVGLVFGIVVCVSGFVGAFIGGETSAQLRPILPTIEGYLCFFSTFLASITIFFGVYFSAINLMLTWVCIGVSIFLLSLLSTPNSDLMLKIVGPKHRARASAIQILSIHALGDAISPYIVGHISDTLKKDNSLFWEIKSLRYALFITPFFLLLGSFAYALSIQKLPKDMEKTEHEARSMRPVGARLNTDQELE